MFFLFEITSVPQETYYIWATTSPEVNLADSLTQNIGFGFAFANILSIVGIFGAIFSDNFVDISNDPSL